MAEAVDRTLEYTFARYLAAKRSVDDRALNRGVWRALQSALAGRAPGAPLRVLEVGAGIGSMIERCLEWGLFANIADPVSYLAIDNNAENIACATQRLRARETEIDLCLEAADFFEFASRPQMQSQFDLIIAHAVLDLLDLQRALPLLAGLLAAGGLGYLTINFDGLTSLEPTIDPAFDDAVEAIYHRTMDERVTDGVQSGDSRTGRHLFRELAAHGYTIHSAGASDWVVFGAGQQGYPDDEAYFLHFIVHTLDGALCGRSELDQQCFARWVEQRHRQIDAGELVYIAHQLDFLVSVRGSTSG
jgi:ubiquinone/menaquinone biosynthesis C-methylase UbiE